jgi:protein FAM32A
MPGDEYASVGGGGALKLKGAKVGKKKKRKDKSDLEKNLATGEITKVDRAQSKQEDDPEASRAEEDEVSEPKKTESELRYEEFKKKRVSCYYLTTRPLYSLTFNRQLLKMAEASGSRPELLKTHKERVEELNTYLSKLSEHHDMPKIGPG